MPVSQGRPASLQPVPHGEVAGRRPDRGRPRWGRCARRAAPARQRRSRRPRRRCRPAWRAASSVGMSPNASLQELGRVGPGALGVREVVAPHQVADADLVAADQLAPLRVRGADEAVAVEVLRRPHRQVRRELRAQLLRAVLAVEHRVHPPQQVVHPERPALGDREPESREALEHARPDEEPQRAGTTRTAPRRCRSRCAGRTTPCRRGRSARAPGGRAPGRAAQIGSYFASW